MWVFPAHSSLALGFGQSSCDLEVPRRGLEVAGRPEAPLPFPCLILP